MGMDGRLSSRIDLKAHVLGSKKLQALETILETHPTTVLTLEFVPREITEVASSIANIGDGKLTSRGTSILDNTFDDVFPTFQIILRFR